MASMSQADSFHFHRKLQFTYVHLKSPLLLCSISTFTHENQPHPFYKKTFYPYAPTGDPSSRADKPMIVISGFKLTTLVTNCLIQIYIKCSRLECAGKVFDRMSERDRVSWNAMIFGYSISGKMDPAQSFFDSMLKRDVISWNSLISGYLQNGNCLKSVEIFVLMGRDGAVAYDETTFSVVLKAYSDEEDYSVGRQIHRVMVKLGF